MTIIDTGELTNVQKFVARTILTRAPESGVEPRSPRGLTLIHENIDTEKLATLNRAGVDFNVLLSVMHEVGKDNEEATVEPGVTAVIFNALLDDVSTGSDGIRHPLKDLPETIIGNLSTDDRVQDNRDPFLQFAIQLRDRSEKFSTLQATAAIGELKAGELWGFVAYIVYFSSKSGVPADMLALKNLAKRIDEEKAIIGVHQPESIRLLMNVQTILDGGKDYRTK